jgi:hypothetical protein
MTPIVRRAALILSLLLLALPTAATRRAADRLLQAATPERGWVLSVESRRARLEAADGARMAFRVRRDEQWLEFAEFGNGWIAAGIRPREDGLDLSLVADTGRGSRRLAQPAERQGALRTGPTALVSPAGLAGLAWLEGDSLTGMAVRAAPFFDGAFGSVTTVSAAGPGSQSGLSGAVLEDGTWLLAWSRFDGRDDEVFWAARTLQGSWSAPRRLTRNNATPDVTPRLLALGNDALVAWSRLEEEYEVVTARFSSGDWSSPQRLGVQGALTPTFRRLRGEDYLLVRNAWPAGWTAFRLDGAGRAVDFASVAEDSLRPPVLRPGGGDAMTFEWPDRQAPIALAWEPVR